MQILNIAPKDIHVTLDLSVMEIQKLIKAMDMAKVDYDSQKEPDMTEAVDCLKSFYLMLIEVEDGLPKHSAA